MSTIKNVIYIVSDSYLRLDGENLIIEIDKIKKPPIPLVNIESIVLFGYHGVSPLLFGYCSEHNIPITFLTGSGRFLTRVNRDFHGGIFLRKKQYLLSENEDESILIARNMIYGKVANQKYVLKKFCREYEKRIDISQIENVVKQLNQYLEKIAKCSEKDILRGYEGNCASLYFGVLNNLILQNKEDFYIHDRNKRPPLDNVNAMLSFLYALLENDCSCALESVGLDPYCGFMHADRPGRRSLACDLMEEMRAVMVDRLVIRIINKKIIKSIHFEEKENGSIYLNNEGKQILINEWQKRKKEEITHPYLQEKIIYGLIPHKQAMLLSRTLREDIEEYPPFLWR